MNGVIIKLNDYDYGYSIFSRLSLRAAVRNEYIYDLLKFACIVCDYVKIIDRGNVRCEMNIVHSYDFHSSAGSFALQSVTWFQTSTTSYLSYIHAMLVSQFSDRLIVRAGVW